MRLFAVEGVVASVSGWRRGLSGWKFSHIRPKDLDVLHATFATPDLTTFCRLDELGLEVVGQHLAPDRAG